jgi:hypothetical protein
MGWAQGRFGWGTFGSEGPQFNVADTEVLGNVQLSLIEPNDGGITWPSLIWTAAQALSFLNDRMRKLLNESGMTVSVAYQAGTAGQTRYPLPDNLQDVRRAAWANEADPMAYVELPRTDAWELDHGRTNWPSSSAQSPEVYTEDHLPSLTIEVIPAPTDAGELELTFNADGTPATGAGTILSVPDDWTPYLAWGVRADMLASEYEGNDPVRAQHCSDRFDEGVELARILVDGGGSSQ